MKKTIPYILAFVFLTMGCGEKEIYVTSINVLDLLPDDDEISGWIKTEYARYAETADQLTSIINGEAVPYIDNGFQAAVFQKYEGIIGSMPIPLDVQIFDMGDSINAKNVYDDIETAGDSAWIGSNPGREARINVSFLFSYQIDFWADKFFVRTIIEDKSSEGLSTAQEFAFNISDAINNTDLSPTRGLSPRK